MLKVKRKRTKKERKLDAAAIADRVFSGLLLESPRAKLDKLIERAYPANTLEESWIDYRKTISKHGNPKDQIERFENAGIILQPKQLEYAAWARRLDNSAHIIGDNPDTPVEDGSPQLGFGGARGPGKSFVGFTQMAVDDCQRLPGAKCLYLRKTSKKADEQLNDLVRSVLSKVKHQKIRGLVRFPNGSTIIIGHYAHENDLDDFLGIEYDIILIEETTILREEAYLDVMASLRTSKDWRPRIYNSTNPLGIGHQWYKKVFVDHERKYGEKQDRSCKFIFATVDDNKFVNVDYVGNLNKYTGVKLKAYRFGDWDVSAGAYFDEWNYDRHVVDEYYPQPEDQVWASMDAGFNHWNCWYLHAKTADGVIYTFAEMTHRKHYPHEIAPEFKELLAEFGLAPHNLMMNKAGGDVFNEMPHSAQTLADQYAALGIKLTRAITDPGSRIAGAHRMARLLGNHERDIPPRWFVAKRCTRLIDTIPMMECNPNNPEDVLKVDMAQSGNGGDDAYDGVRYGLYTEKPKGRLTVSHRRTI